MLKSALPAFAALAIATAVAAQAPPAGQTFGLAASLIRSYQNVQRNVLEAAQKNNPSLAERAGIEACIECGICSYVCPSKLPLLEGIRKLRSG